MPDQQGEPVSLDDFREPLPPALEQFISQLHADKKKLLKDKAFADANQQRRFHGLYLYPALEKMFRLLAGMAMESYGLAASNTNQLRRLHGFVVDELNELGADLPDDAGVPGVSPAVLDEFQAAFYALGTALQEKAPEDTDLQNAYNLCAQALSEVVGQLMDGGGYDDDFDNDEFGDDHVEDAPPQVDAPESEDKEPAASDGSGLDEAISESSASEEMSKKKPSRRKKKAPSKRGKSDKSEQGAEDA